MTDKNNKMKINKIRVARIAVVSTLLFIPVSGCVKEQKVKPNIILILADDLGYADIGCYGGIIETPNLDRLASEGVMFTQFYNTARCCPSRASLLTGLYPHQTGLGAMVGNGTNEPGYKGEINYKCATLAEVLHSTGYSTYMAGKWHVASSRDGSDKHNWPIQRGFDHYFGIIDGASSYFEPHLLVHDNDTLLSSPSGFYLTDAISDSTVTFIDHHLNNSNGKPFFMYVAYTAPHWPLHAPPEDIAKYKGRFDSGWDKLREEKLKRMENIGLIKPEWSLTGKDPDVLPWDDVENKKWELARMEVYAAMVDCVDRGIGRIVRELEIKGQMDNTLIIFLSDNGACDETWSIKDTWVNRYGPKVTREGLIVDYSNNGSKNPGPADTYYSYGKGWAHYSNTPFKNYKSSTYEGGISTPFIVHWPGKTKNNKILRKQLAGIIDIMPTLVEVSGAEYPELLNGNAILPMEGKSLVKAICTNEELPRDAYYFEHIGRRGMIEENRWKIVKYGPQPWQLYDLENDRTETDDLSAKKSEMTKQLIEKWERWAWRTNVLPNTKQ